MTLPAVLAVLALIAPDNGVAPVPAEAALEGSWTVTSVSLDGLDLTKHFRDTQCIFHKDTFTLRQGDTLERVKYKIVKMATPLHIDLRNQSGGVFKGIITTEKDTLKLCYSSQRGQERPTRFETKPGSHRMLLVLKRWRKKG